MALIKRLWEKKFLIFASAHLECWQVGVFQFQKLQSRLFFCQNTKRVQRTNETRNRCLFPFPQQCKNTPFSGRFYRHKIFPNTCCVHIYICVALFVDNNVVDLSRHILITKQTRCTNSSNLFLEWNSTHFRQFLCPSSGVFRCTHSNGTCHTGFLTACCVYSKKLLMMDCPKHVEFYAKNKFEKWVLLVGFITRIYHDARSPERQNLSRYSYILRM